MRHCQWSHQQLLDIIISRYYVIRSVHDYRSLYVAKWKFKPSARPSWPRSSTWSPACTTESIVTSLINYLSWELHVSTTMPSMPAKKTKLKTKFLKTGTMGPLRMTSALGQYSIPIDQYLGLMPNKSNGLATPQALLALNQTWDIWDFENSKSR